MARRPRLVLVLAAALGLMVPGPAAADLAGAYLAARSAGMEADFAAARDYLIRALAEDPANPGLLEQLVLANVGAGDVAAAVPVARRLMGLPLVQGNLPIARLVILADRLAREDYTTVLAELDQAQAAERELIGALVDPLLRGWAQLGAGSMVQAIAAFDSLTAESGLASFGRYHKALALAVAGDYEGAEELLADSENDLRGLRRAVMARVAILSQLGRNDEATTLLDEAFPGAATPEITLMRQALATGAALPFDTVRTARDGMAEVFHILSIILQRELPEVQVLTQSRIAEFLRPDHVDAIMMSAALLEALNRHELAIATYERVPTDHPARLEAEGGKADALYRLGRKDEAVATLEQLATANPDDLTAQIALGDMLRREERFADAAAAYSRAIEQLPAAQSRSWALFYSRAIAWERAREWTRAEPDFRRALELNPDQPEVLNYLGYSLLDRHERIPEALAMIEQAVAQRPNDGYIIDSLAWGYFLTGRYPEALEYMEKAALLMPVDPIVTDHLGDVYWAVGRRDEARFQWRRALSFDPEDEDAARIRRKLTAGLDEVLAEDGLPALDERRARP